MFHQSEDNALNVAARFDSLAVALIQSTHFVDPRVTLNRLCCCFGSSRCMCALQRQSCTTQPIHVGAPTVSQSHRNRVCDKSNMAGRKPSINPMRIPQRCYRRSCDHSQLCTLRITIFASRNVRVNCALMGSHCPTPLLSSDNRSPLLLLGQP